MSMTKRGLLAVAVLAATLGVFESESGRASAQDVEITGPLAGQPAVRHMRIYRRGRVQLQPLVAFTLTDEFSRTMLVGAQAQFHLTDWLGIGAWGGFGLLHLDTGLTDQVQQLGQTTDRNRLSLPSRESFPDQIGQLQWAAALQLAFIPLRGKLSLFQKLFVDADFYVFLGGAVVGVEERADVPENTCDTASGSCTDSQTARASRVAFAPTFGAGLTMFINQFISLTFEWRGIPFSWNTAGTDEGGHDETGVDASGGNFPDGIIDSSDRNFHFNHMFVLGVSFYLPTAVRVSE